MASFPSSVKTFSTIVDLVDSVLAAHQNQRGDEITAIETYLLEAATEITVSGGVLTVTKSRHKVQPQSGTADDIDTITGIPDGTTLMIYASDAGTDTLTLKHGTGNLSCFGASDIALSTGFALCYRSGSTVYVAGGGGAAAPTVTSDLYNFIINGGHDIADRNVTPGTLFTVADKDFGADRWWVTRENADVQYNRNDATGESGLTSKHYGLYKKITNSGKFVVVQVIEGVNSVPLRGKEVTFQIKMKASGSKTIRMAVLELQTAGTIDAPPATLVTAFGADTTDPTFGTNVAIITGAESKSVTTSWQSFSVTVTVPTNSKNVMAAFWTDSDFAANDTLSVAEAGLFITDTIQDWKPRLISEETILCQRFYYRWGYENSDSGTGFRMFGYGGTGVYEGQSIRHPVMMHKVPTATINGTFGTTNITGAPSIVDLSTQSATVSFQVTSTGTFDFFSNGTDDWFSFEAEIL